MSDLNSRVVGAQLARGLITLGFAAAAETATIAGQSPSVISIHPDGSIIVSAAQNPAAEPERTASPRRFEFGLPGAPPKRRELEDGNLPVARTQWEKNGIRYTQIALLSRLEGGELWSRGRLPDDSVLLVQVLGENTAGEYTEATADFSVQVGGEARELELREDRVCEIGPTGASPLAIVDIPPTGIAGTRGLALRFRGHMPPGTSGAMTLKIPLQPLTGEAALSRLRELEFDEEFRRVKRFWTDRFKAGVSGPPPLALAEAGSPSTARHPGAASDIGRSPEP